MSDWQPFTREYEKRFYEVLAGNRILQHFWPNGGLLIGSGLHEDDPKGWYLKLGYNADISIRPCQCEKCSAQTQAEHEGTAQNTEPSGDR